MQGPYYDLGSSANFWSAYSYIGTGRGYSLWHTIQEVFITGYGMTTGFSVRCIKN